MIGRRARARAITLAIALLAATSIATAQEARDRRGPDRTAGSDDDARRPDIPRREPLDYDGRPDPGIDAIDVLLWIPRVIFWPVHAVFEYLLRRPLGWILTTGERERWDVLQIQPLSRRGAPSWGAVPTFLFDLGFRPAVGLHVWLDDVVERGNDLRLEVGFSGIGWLRAVVLDRLALSASSDVELRFDAVARPDYLFVGIGGGARPEIQSRFGGRSLAGAIRSELRPWRASRLGIEARVAAHEFYDTDERWGDGERTISDAIAQGWYPNLSTLPPGFDGYTSYSQRVEGALDTREAGARGSGVRVEAHAELGVDLTRALDRRWFLGGGGAGASLDLDHGRTLELGAVADLAAPLGPEAVPFTELPDVGDRGPMTAFRRGWLIGESVAAAVLEYRYPIWVAMEGFVKVAVGNAFGAAFAGFEPRRLRTSYALGLRTVGDRDQSFTLQIGLGTATFEDGLDPAILRLTAGMQEGL